MAADGEFDADLGVLRSKRDATGYRILVQIAERQPAVSQREIADAIGVTPQAVSDYLGRLVDRGFVENPGRGRYEVTKEGVDWLISQTAALEEFVEYVSGEVIGGVEVEAAVATAAIEEGDPVSLSMRDGTLHATPGAAGSATAVAVTDAEAGTDVGVTDFEGIVEHAPGTVTIVPFPAVSDGGSRAAPPGGIRDAADDHDLLATAGVEALAAARGADREPDLRFGTPEAVREAATKGLDVLLLATAGEVAAHTRTLRDGSVSYEVVDAAEL